MRLLRPVLTIVFASICSTLLAEPAPPPAIPKEVQTSLGLYATPAEAYAKWKADPEKVRVLDVRTPEEYVFVGHPPMAWNVPIALQTWQWDPKGQYLLMKPNPEFVQQVSGLFGRDETILVICRSGNRSAKAVNALAAAGYTRVYNVIEGVEGDVVNDPSSPAHGTRAKNGWKNAGLPVTYELDPAKLKLPAAQ